MNAANGNWVSPPTSEELICEDKLRRLKCCVPGPLSDIKVVNLDKDKQNPVWLPLFPDDALQGQGDTTATASHPLAAEYVTDPPVSRLRISLLQISAYENFSDFNIDEPESLVIQTKDADSGGITVGQFVTEVHEYVSKLRDILCCVGYFGENSGLFWGYVACGPEKRQASEPDLNCEIYFVDPSACVDRGTVWQGNVEYLQGLRSSPPEM